MTARRHRACAPGQPASPALRLTRPRPNVFADIEPGKYSKLNAGRPVCMCFSWLAVYIVLALLMALGLKDFSIMMNFVFSDEKATTNLQFQGFAEASKPENRYESRSFAADNTTYMESAYTYDAFDGGNLFDSADKVSAMARAEEFVLAVRDWTTHCTKVISFTDGSAQCESPKTLLNYLYVSDEAHEVGPHTLTQRPLPYLGLSCLGGRVAPPPPPTPLPPQMSM